MLTRRRRGAALAVLLAVLSAASALAACTTGVSGSPPAQQSTPASRQSPSPGSGSRQPTQANTVPATTTSPPARTVHVSSVIGDGEKVGVGMPIILRFTPAPTDSSAFTHAVTVTVNGQPAHGAWYWEQPTAQEAKAHTIEAHYRLSGYWPHNSTVQVRLPIKGLSAGKGLVYAGGLTSVTFQVGDAHVSTVDYATLRMTVTDNGKQVAPPGESNIKVSLGKFTTPTYNGIKVVMQKGEDDPATGKLRPDGAVIMRGPGYENGELVDWSVRITQDGEYVHSAPWNPSIGELSTSNGCTNLSNSDAEWFYKFSQVGDVLQYYNTNGTKMQPWNGYGDWNVAWQAWKQGNLLPNH